MLKQQEKLLWVLVLFHLSIIAASNYLVQIPINILGLHTTWGTFTFPFIFLATDLTVRLFGGSLARNIIFVAMFPALIVSYVFSVMFSDAQFQGIAPLFELNTFVARIALASFFAYVVGQVLDVAVFEKLRSNTQWYWWVAPAISTAVGSFIDTLIFFFVAFYQSTDPFMAEHWVEIAWVDYGFKLCVSLLLFVPMYGVIMNTWAKRLR